MKTEYVLQYKWNRKWIDGTWKGKSKAGAISERNYRSAVSDYVYRVVKRKTTETVIK